MTYIDWVDRVLERAVKTANEDENRGSIGIGLAAVANAAGVGMDQIEVQQALRTAGQDLAAMGLIEREQWLFRVKPNGIKVARAGGLRTRWPALFASVQPLEEDLQVLRAVVAESEVEDQGWADMKTIELKDVLTQFGREATQMAAHAISERLYHEGCISEPLRTFAWCQVRPSYIGAVIATQKEISEREQLVGRLIEQWETTSIDVKEVLRLGSDRNKAEFCKDVLALANTRVSGRRFMVLGFSDQSREFTTSVDPKVDAHRMESVLSGSCLPVPRIKYSVVPLQAGDAGLIEVFSDRADLPYRLGRKIWKFASSTVFARHNTLAVAIDGPELEGLIEEGRRARGG
jgi:hypothetical protein